jgi:oligopeptide/dipeptide ABC transporter ATP-binding protein
MAHPEVLFEARGLSRTFSGRRTSNSPAGANATSVRAVSALNLTIHRGEILGLVGESGCGKSTTGMLLTLLERPDAGTLRFEGEDASDLRGKRLQAFRRRVQIVFQDPYESLDPRFTVESTLTEPLIVHGIGRSSSERRRMVRETLERVELRPADAFLNRYPRDLSGGQRQRIAIARAIILNPDFLVADEPVSMLDVSVRAGVLNLMKRLRDELRMTYLFITHDLAVARYMSDRIAVMYLGKIVEIGRTETILGAPQHPYTQLLLQSVPEPDPDVKQAPAFEEYAIPDATDVPVGCPFHPRCPFAMDACRRQEPVLLPTGDDHDVSCFLYHEPVASGHGDSRERSQPAPGASRLTP